MLISCRNIVEMKALLILRNRLFYERKGKVPKAKGNFYQKAKGLDIYEKLILMILTGRVLDYKRESFGSEKIETLFYSYCEDFFIGKKDFSEVIGGLVSQGFIEKGKDKIRVRVPYRECYSMRFDLMEEFYTKHLVEKEKLRKGKIYHVHLSAEERGKIIGFLSGHYIKLSNSVYGEGEIDSLLVDEKYRHKGVGKQLAEKFLDICKKNKIDYVSLITPVKNKKAIKFYKRLGFEKHNVVYMYWSPYKF